MDYDDWLRRHDTISFVSTRHTYMWLQGLYFLSNAHIKHDAFGSAFAMFNPEFEPSNPDEEEVSSTLFNPLILFDELLTCLFEVQVLDLLFGG